MITIAKFNRKQLSLINETDSGITQPRLIDGLDVLEALCPVSKNTGLRENMLSLVRKMINDPAKQRLLIGALQEIPTSNQPSSMTDDQKVDFLTMRLESGTPAENDSIRQTLLDMIPDLPSGSSSPVSKDSIEFNKDDAPDSNVE